MNRIRWSGLLWLAVIAMLIAACNNQSRGPVSPQEPPVSETNENNAALQPNEQADMEPTETDNVEEPAGSDDAAAEEELIDPVEALMHSLTIEQKIGQLVLAGLEGVQLGEDARTLIDRHVGGFILFGRNVQNDEQVASFLREIYAYNEQQGVPLFLSVDEEGGRVSRMPAGATGLPSARVLGQTSDGLMAGEVAYLSGRQLHALGYNMNFAPVLDVDSNPANPVIGDRAYGTTAEAVMQTALPVMYGYRDAGVIPVVKHFPGHGDTHVDSHNGLPVITHEMARLEAVELAPFRQAVEEKVEAIMVGHLLVSAIDNERPASLSPLVMQDLLRHEWGYEGVIVTDDLAAMKAIVEERSSAEAAWQAIEAGADIVMIAHGLQHAEDALDRLHQAYVSGELSDARLDASVARILRLKLTYKLDEPPVAYDPQALQELSAELAERLAQSAE